MGYQYYHYDPSSGAAVSFAAVFGLTTVIHIWQMIRTRTWYLTPFVIGGICTFCLTFLAGYTLR